jgi:hypothetical protein
MSALGSKYLGLHSASKKTAGPRLAVRFEYTHDLGPGPVIRASLTVRPTVVGL